MKANAQAAVGAFVLGGLALAVAAIVLFGKFSLFTPNIKAAIVFQDSIAGLSIGAPVSFRGVRVGAVESIDINFNADSKIAYIPVIINLKPDQSTSAGRTVDIAGLIKLGLRAALRRQRAVS